MLDPWFKRTLSAQAPEEVAVLAVGANTACCAMPRRVLFTCEEERLLARQSFWLYRAHGKSSVRTAPPAADRRRPRCARSLPGALSRSFAGKRLLLFLGRIHEKKGCDLLIEAFAARAPISPDAASRDGRARRRATGARSCRPRAAELGIADRITWTGMLAGDLKWGAFHASDAFCLPSHQENFGIAVAEALACGCRC